MQGRRIVSETLLGLGLAPEQFQVLPANAGVKVQWARRLRRETTLNLKWIARELGVGSCKYLSNLLEQQAPRRVLAVMDDPRVVEKILRQLGAWHDPPARPPPAGVPGPYIREPCQDVGPIAMARIVRAVSRWRRAPMSGSPGQRSVRAGPRKAISYQ